VSKQNITEIDAFTKDNRMARKTSIRKVNKEESKEYACIGGNPKVRREMKRHKDMVKKFGKHRVIEDKD
jgi:hypothetical protein